MPCQYDECREQQAPDNLDRSLIISKADRGDVVVVLSSAACLELGGEKKKTNQSLQNDRRVEIVRNNSHALNPKP